MFLEFDDGSWVVYKKLTLRGYQLIKQGWGLLALPLHIIEWSESAEINIKNVKRLSAKKAEIIQKKLLESVEPVLSLDRTLLKKWIELMFNNSRIVTRDSEKFNYIRDNYFQYALLYTDHKGNIINLPEPGGILDQPLDWIIFLMYFKIVFTEQLNASLKKKGR